MSVIASLAAELRLEADQFFRGMRDSEEAIRQFSGATQTHAASARSAMESVGAESNKAAAVLKGNLAGAMRGVAEATGLAIGAFTIWKTIEVASRAEEMDVALQRLGKNAGLTTEAVKEQTSAIKEMGITTNVAQYTLSQFLKQNLDSSKAAQLARVAQDAAVYSMQNSSATLQSLIYGVQTYQTEIFRTAGLNVNVGKSFEDYAQQIGKATDDLTEGERQTAVLNAVLKEGATVSGTYEAAMGSASKQMRSFPRYIEEMQEAIGTAFLPAFTDAVFGLTDFIKGIQKLVSEGGALQPIISTTAKLAGIPFAAMGKAVKGLADNMEKFRIPLQIVATLLVTKAAIGLVGMIANWVKYRIEVAQATLAQRQLLSQYGVEIQEAIAAARAEEIHAAAITKLAASAGIATGALERLFAAKAANSGLAPGQYGPPTPVAKPGLGAGVGGALASVGPQLAVMAAITAGFMTYQGVQEENQKTKDISANRIDAALERQDSVEGKIREARRQRELALRRAKAPDAYEKARNKGVLASFWDSSVESARRALRRGVTTDASAAQYGADVATNRAGYVTKGDEARSDAKVAEDRIKKFKQAQKDANVVIKDLAHNTGSTTKEVKDLASAMGIDLYQSSKAEEQALKDNLYAMDEATAANGRFAKAIGESANAERTLEERSAALSSAMKALVDNTYSVAISSRSAMDALSSQDKAFKDASKTGGDTLKKYKQAWAEHNQSIANSFIEASTAMRETGTNAATYIAWAQQFTTKAEAQARAQGQTNEQVKEYRDLLQNLTALNLSKLNPRQLSMALGALPTESLKITESSTAAALIDQLGKNKQTRATIDTVLYPRIDWSKMDADETKQIFDAATKRGAPIRAEMLYAIYGIEEAKNQIAELRALTGEDKQGRIKTIKQRYELLLSARLDPTMVAAMRWVRALAGQQTGTGAAGPVGPQGEGGDFLAPGVEIPAALRNMAIAMNENDFNNFANPPVKGIGSGPDSSTGYNPGGGGGGKSAEELAREARRMQTAMQTISRLALPPAAQAAFNAFPELADREKIAKDLESWRENYAKTLAGIVQSTDASTAKIVASWGLPQEQLSAVAGWVNSLGASMRQFSNVTNVNALASGRAGNRLEEWVDGLIELKNRGLNPTLLRQLLDAGPESLGAVRRLLRGGDLLNKANEQYNRITNEINTLISDPMLGVGLGADLATGVGKGIADSTPQIVTASTQFLWTLIAEMKKAMGIASPSKVTAALIGAPMAEGISHAIRAGSTGVGQALQEAVDSVDTLPPGSSGATSGGAAVIENHFHVAGFIVDKTSVDAMIEAQDWAMRTSGGR